MEDYSTLVKQITKVPLLAQQVQAFAEDHDALNLVTENWKEHLENHTPFQEFQQNTSRMFQPEYESWNNVFRVQNIQENVTPLKVIVAGVCKMYKPFAATSKRQSLSIIMDESPVMDMLTKALTNDVDSTMTQLNPTCKLNMKACSMFCRYCSNAKEKMIANRVRVSSQYLQPCISDTFVYDGKSIVNRFGSQILEFFPGSFIAIVKLELNVRYFYISKQDKKDNVRVGGSVLKVLCFPESNLEENQVELGNLQAIADTEVNAGYSFLEDESSENTRLEKKRSLIDEDDIDDDEDVIDVLPAEKKQKTWEDNFDVIEDTVLL